jgi:hypothetical protein
MESCALFGNWKQQNHEENTMTHLLVSQLIFARSEFVRCLDGISEEEGIRRIDPMNSISWMIGHLASQENFFWVRLGQGIVLERDLVKLVGTGRPASTPPLLEMWDKWREITSTADGYLNQITTSLLTETFELKGKSLQENIGTLLLRNIYHYWFHIGEAHAVRQMLGHEELPQFVGDMSIALYQAETT